MSHALPVTPGFMDIITAGPVRNPTYLDGAIGTSFFTPEQGAFRAMRRKYGTLDDPDAGGYSLAQIDWNKESGTADVSMMEPTATGWYSHAHGVTCNCDPAVNTGPCQCH